MNTLFLVLHLIVTVLLITVVLLQEGKDPGMRGITGSTGSESDSFFSKNMGRTRQALFSKMTAVISVLFLITTLVSVILNA